MPKKTPEDWESLWDSLDGSDADKTEAMFAEYVRDSKLGLMNLPVIKWFTGLTASYARAKEVKAALVFAQREAFAAMHLSIEFMLACVKHEIIHYKPYRLFNAGYHYKRNPKPNRTDNCHETYLGAHSQGMSQSYPGTDDFFIQFFRSDGEPYNDSVPLFRYAVITPQGQRVMDTIFKDELYRAPFIQDHQYQSHQYRDGYLRRSGTLSDARSFPKEYLLSLFDVTSKRGHTRGPYIQETDDLFVILDLIKRKAHFDYNIVDSAEVLERYQRLGGLINITPVSLWKKQGDFTQPLRVSDGLLTHQQQYMHHTPSIMNMFQLSRYSDGGVALRVGMHDRDVYHQFSIACSMAELPKPSDTPFHNNGLMEYTLHIKTSADLPLIECLLNVIDAIDLSAIDVTKEIAVMLGIYRSEKEQDMRALIDHAKAAQTLKDYTSIWNLAKRYRMDFLGGRVSSELLIELFEAISSESPHYQDAQVELMTLIGFEIPDGTNDWALIAKQCKHAFMAGEQTYADQFYHQLRGGEGLEPTMKGVKPDVETLIALAEETRQLNQQMHLMQKQIDEMRLELNHRPRPVQQSVWMAHTKSATGFFSANQVADKKEGAQRSGVAWSGVDYK